MKIKLVFSALIHLMLVTTEAHAGGACNSQALSFLQANDPKGFSVYQELKDKKSFLKFVDCKSKSFDAATAVHEGTHMLTAQKESYPLDDGTSVPLVTNPKLPPKAILNEMRATMKSETFKTYVDTYLASDATSKDQFQYLLNEFNAYSRDNFTTSRLPRNRLEQMTSGRDALASMMLFVKTYLETLRRDHPADWATVMRPANANTVRALWKQGETALKASCAVSADGIDDAKILRHVYSAKNSAAINELLGRRVEQACLPPGSNDLPSSRNVAANESESRSTRN